MSIPASLVKNIVFFTPTYKKKDIRKAKHAMRETL